MTIDAFEFVKTGRMGVIALGTSVARVHAAAGLPDSRTAPGLSPEMQRFGRLQIQIRSGVIHGIFLSTLRLNRPSYPRISYENIGSLLEASVGDATRLLAAMGLSVHVDKTLTSEWQTTLVVGDAGVRMAFNAGGLST